MKNNVEVNLDLGKTKSAVVKAAKDHGLTVEEFIVNAVESRIRRERPLPQNFVRHGGKHMMGKSTGYEVTKDGKYYPAPTHTDVLDALNDENAAVQLLMESVIRHANERLTQIRKRFRERFDHVLEDLGLDPDKHWGYYGSGRNGYVAEIISDDSKKV